MPRLALRALVGAWALTSGDLALTLGVLALVMLWELVGWASGGSSGFWG